MISKVLALVTLVAFVLLSTLMQVTSPATIHPIGILALFVLFYVFSLGVLTFFIFGFERLLAMFNTKKLTHTAFTMQRAYYYASVIALAPVLLIAMRSIGRANIWDIILILAFEGIACFYIAKRR